MTRRAATPRPGRGGLGPLLPEAAKAPLRGGKPLVPAAIHASASAVVRVVARAP